MTNPDSPWTVRVLFFMRQNKLNKKRASGLLTKQVRRLGGSRGARLAEFVYGLAPPIQDAADEVLPRRDGDGVLLRARRLDVALVIGRRRTRPVGDPTVQHLVSLFICSRAAMCRL